jgi:hypothetical protein
MDVAPGILEEIAFRRRRRSCTPPTKVFHDDDKSHSSSLHSKEDESHIVDWRRRVKHWSKSPSELKFSLTKTMLRESKTIMNELFNISNCSVLQRLNEIEVKLLFLLLGFEEKDADAFTKEIFNKSNSSVNFAEFYAKFMKLHIFENIFFKLDGDVMYCQVPSSSIIFESLSKTQIDDLANGRRRGSLESEVRTSVLKKITRVYKHRFKAPSSSDMYTVPVDIYIDACRRKVRFLAGKHNHSFLPRNTSATRKGRWIKHYLNEKQKQ